jgi:signal transduction histidine kinase
MACIGQLAAGIAHDINNPVGFISHNLVILDRYLKRLKQFVDLQKLLIKGRADAELITAWERSWKDFDIHGLFHELPIMLSECRDGTARISQTVQSLRNFSHKEIPQLKRTDIHQSIESSLSIICHQLRNKIEVVRDYGQIPRLDCYPGQISQVFLNLLINATQAIAEQGEISLRTWADDRRIYVSISDNGCGIPADKLERIFEPFFTTKDVGVGTGLGLSIVYDIVTRHQGSIEVVSKIGEGTTFTLSLPFNKKPIPWDRQEEAVNSGGLTQAETGHCCG